MRIFLGAICGVSLMCCSWAVNADDVPRSVTIDVLIAGGAGDVPAGEVTPAAIRELEKAGQLDWVTRMRLTTVENDRAQVQVGERTSIVTGRTQRGGFPGTGGETATMAYVNIGTTIEAIARVADDGSIIIALTAEKSWLEPTVAPAAPAAEAADSPPALQAPRSPSAELPRTRNLTAKTTVTVKPGEPTLALAQNASAGQDESQVWIVLTAKVAEGRKPVAAEAPVLKVFYLKFGKVADLAKVLASVFDREPRLKIAVDERINGIIAQGPPATLEVVEALLTQLDAAAKPSDE
jgi:type II secretory pathway component GspD/PulD (secretin)